MGTKRDELGCAGVAFAVMVLMEGGTIALTIWAKTVMTGGMSPFVFVVYTNALSSLFLLPYSFVFHANHREKSLFTIPLLVRAFFLGFTGITLSQNLLYLGLSYSSPILVCAMGLLTPAFSFLLSLIFRGAQLHWKSFGFQTKLIGTFISIAGALMADLYKGPVVRNSAPHMLQHASRLFIFSSSSSSSEYWVLGGTMLAAATFSISLWNVIQLGAVKVYPHVMKLAALYSFIGTIQSAIVALHVERDLTAWKLGLDMELLLIVITALFGGLIRNRVHIWCANMKGPIYVPMFQPFRILWATFFGSAFFASSLHYGSVIAACIAGIGYYTVMWGQIRGDEEPKNHDIESNNSSEKTVPFLQEDTQV